MGQWEHLFIDGEFMSRARLLSGLTVEQVSVRPLGLPHTIYEELWHTTIDACISNDLSQT